MKLAVLIAAALTVSSCAMQQPQPLPVEVKVPVAVSCIKPDDVPAKPDYQSIKDNDTTPDGTVVLHIARDFATSISYQKQLEALMIGCL